MLIRPAEHQTDEQVQRQGLSMAVPATLISQNPLLPEVTVKPEAPDRVSGLQGYINTSNSVGKGRGTVPRLCKGPDVFPVLFSKIPSWGILAKRGAEFVTVCKPRGEQGPLSTLGSECERKGDDRPTLVVVFCFGGVNRLLFAF